jgi:anion transporter
MSVAVSSSAPAKSQVVSTAKWVWLIVAVAIGGLIAALPTPQGLSHIAHMVLAITAFTVVLWAAQVMNSGVASVLLMALLIIIGVPVPRVFSGFGGGAFWTLLAVLFYGFAMKKTGLAERLSYYILSLFPGTYAGILTSFFIIGFVLALGIPSMTVRTAIMTPVAWALVQSLGLPPRSRGSALIILTTVEMAVVPGIAFLYGSLTGPVVVAAFEAKKLPITWLGYAQVTTFPTLVLCALILIGNQFILRPEAPLKASPTFARDRLRELGPFKRPEAITGLVVLFSIVFWSTDSYHHLPAFLIGMVAMAVFYMAGILRDEDIGTGVSWTLLLFIGGIFSLANIIQDYKVTDWIAGYIVPIVKQIEFSVVILSIMMALAMYALRFIDPSSFIAVSVLFLSTVTLTMAAGIPPLVLMCPIILASAPFWVSYQNFWLAMAEGLTANQAFTAAHRVRLANAYAIFCLIALAISVPYWHLIGLLH